MLNKKEHSNMNFKRSNENKLMEVIYSYSIKAYKIECITLLWNTGFLK